MEKPITVQIESAEENGILSEMYVRNFIELKKVVSPGARRIKVTPAGRKFLNKLINPIKQNNTEKK